MCPFEFFPHDQLASERREEVRFLLTVLTSLDGRVFLFIEAAAAARGVCFALLLLLLLAGAAVGLDALFGAFGVCGAAAAGASDGECACFLFVCAVDLLGVGLLLLLLLLGDFFGDFFGGGLLAEAGGGGGGEGGGEGEGDRDRSRSSLVASCSCDISFCTYVGCLMFYF